MTHYDSWLAGYHKCKCERCYSEVEVEYGVYLCLNCEDLQECECCGRLTRYSKCDDCVADGIDRCLDCGEIYEGKCACQEGN